MFRKLFATGLLLSFSVHSVFAASFESAVHEGFFKSNAIDTEHFSFEYSDLIKGQKDSDKDRIPDIVETTAEAAERSWAVLVGEEDYWEPNLDEDGRITVILDENAEYMIPGSIGTTSYLTNEELYVALDPWLGEALLQVTMAHEFYHTLQFTLTQDFAYSNQGVGFGESTAVWAEEFIYSDSNDYVGYLTDFYNYSDYSIFASLSPEDTLFPYALSIWPIFLEEYLDETVMKKVWEAYADLGDTVASELRVYEAYRSVLEDEGFDLEEVFQQFTLWNLDQELYEEGSEYPAIWAMDGSLETDEYVNGNVDYGPALFGTNYLYFDNTKSENSFHFHMQKPENVSFGLSLIPVVQGNAQMDRTVRNIFEGDEMMKAEMVLSGISGNTDVVAVISPLGDSSSDIDPYFFDYAYSYAYKAGFGALEGAIDPKHLGGTTEGKDGNPISETGEVRAIESLQLSVRDYNEEEVSLTWNRLTEEEVRSYVVNYGPSSNEEEYEFYLEIDKPYVTFTKIDALEEGVEYVFQLDALDSNGEILASSSEVFVTPEEWLFSDLSYLDTHFQAIQSLNERGVLSGHPDGSFKPESTVNRAEMMRILVDAVGADVDSFQYKNCFSDVKDQWYASYVCYAKEQGWVQGYGDNTFRPGNDVSKVEALTMLFEVLGDDLQSGVSVAELPYPDLATDAWYSIYVWEAAKLGLLEEESGVNFNPSQGRLRGEIAENLYRYLLVNGQ